MRSMDYEICSSIPHLGLGRRLNEIRGGRMNKKMISVHPSPSLGASTQTVSEREDRAKFFFPFSKWRWRMLASGLANSKCIYTDFNSRPEQHSRLSKFVPFCFSGFIAPKAVRKH